MSDLSATLGGDPISILTFGPWSSPEISEEFWSTFPPGSLIGLDTETSGLDHFAPDFSLRLAQFATPDTAWVLDMTDEEQRKTAGGLLAEPDQTFCSHSPMDVVGIGVDLGIDIADRNLDTMVLASMAYTAKIAKRDLKTLTAKHIGPELGEAEEALHERFRELWADVPEPEGRKRKSMRWADIEVYGWAHIASDDPAYLVYAALDAVACRRLVEILTPLTEAPANLLALETWLAGEAARMRQRGMLIDRQAFDTLRAEVDEQFTRTSEAFSAAADGIKPRSYKRVGQWFAEHGADWEDWRDRGGEYTGTGAPSITKDLVHLLGTYSLDRAGRDAFEALSEFKQVAGQKTKLDEIGAQIDAQGRVHPRLNTLGASATARMSSTGPNFQNFSRDEPRMRGCFIPDPGCVLITADFSSVEMRVAAALAGETVLIEAIRNGDDLHQLTADLIGSDRHTGKTVNFQVLYGSGAANIAGKAKISLEEATTLLHRFWRGYPALNQLRQQLKTEHEYIRTPTGRRLEVPRDPVSGEPRSHANLNYLIQSTSRDLLASCWFRFATEYKHADLVWLPIHDELVVQAPDDQAEQIIADLTEAMTLSYRGVPITCDVHVLADEHGVSRWGKA